MPLAPVMKSKVHMGPILLFILTSQDATFLTKLAAPIISLDSIVSRLSPYLITKSAGELREEVIWPVDLTGNAIYNFITYMKLTN